MDCNIYRGISLLSTSYKILSNILLSRMTPYANEIIGGRPRRRWENNIRMDLEEIGINARNWVDSAQDRNYWGALVNAALNLWFHKPWS